ncbi:MAG: ArnT family glycosyltransferase, partial [Planctomycetota bacterium]
MTDPTEQTVSPTDEPLGRLRDHSPSWPHLLAAGGALAGVYLVGVSAKWWPTPDSALIMGLARSLAAGRGYEFNGRPNNIIPPGLPLLVSMVRLLLGGGEWATNLFMALTGLATLTVIYSVLSRLADRRTALAIALCTGFSYVFYKHAHRVLTDIPFVLLFWLAAWYWVSWGRSPMTGAAGAGKRPGPFASAVDSVVTLLTVCALVVTGVVVRFPGAVAFGIFAGAVLIDPKTLPGRVRRAVLSAIILAAAVAAVIGYSRFTRALAGDDPRYIQRAGHALPSGPVDAVVRLGEGLAIMPEVASETFIAQGGRASVFLVGLPVLALILVGSVRVWKARRRAVVVLALAYPLALTLCTGHGNFRARYVMPVTPLWFWLALEGTYAIVRRAVTRRGGAFGSARYLAAASIFTGVIVAANAPRLARDAFYYSYLSRAGGYYRAVGHDETVHMAALVEQSCPPGAPLFMRHNRHTIFHYLTGR